MSMKLDYQLTIKFPPPERKRKPVITELARDSEGRVVTTWEDPDELVRVKTENLVLRTNMNVFLEIKDRKIKKLQQRIKELEHDNSN